MKFLHIYVIVLLTLSANEVLSNFCDHKKLTDGKQNRKGSCSNTIQGDIPSVKQMTSTFITSPKNEAVLEANKPFSVDILISHLETGHFSDPDKEYYTKPQSLNHNGVIKGHTHVTIQELSDNPFPPNAENFVFFEGVNVKAKRGHLSVDVVRKDGTPGLPAGRFRICTMSGTLSHQPLLMPIAKRGAQDDCIRIAVKGKDEKGKGKGKKEKKGKPKRKQ
ncbi:hypothetical protein C1646_716189 [Rhizophagus diaphanus]|nr:hypothetical protein C1646_716189 [Rhizophagus diaphanus] [Rhizophagus sp. MUCL 43196]